MPKFMFVWKILHSLPDMLGLGAYLKVRADGFDIYDFGLTGPSMNQKK